MPNILQLNGPSAPKPLVTRSAPPIPKHLPTVNKKDDDLFLIDLTDSPAQQCSTPFTTTAAATATTTVVTTEERTPCASRALEICEPVDVSSKKLSDLSRTVGRDTAIKSRIDSERFVAKVVSGVTEQLKNDFPRFHCSSHELSPPHVRRFTVPYPSKNCFYSNLPRHQ